MSKIQICEFFKNPEKYTVDLGQKIDCYNCQCGCGCTYYVTLYMILSDYYLCNNEAVAVWCPLNDKHLIEVITNVYN